MKHIFYIQNHTTFRVVLSLISQEELEEDKCIFVIGRGFSPPTTKIKKLDLTPYALSYSIAFWENWIKINSDNKKIKKLIENEIHERFIFYFPLVTFYAVRLILNHRYCISINCLEDGLSAYWSIGERRKAFIKSTFTSFVYSVKICLNHYFSYFPLAILDYWRYWNNGYNKYYTMSEEGFPGLQNRVILRSIKRTKPISDYLKIEYLFAPTALAACNLIGVNTFMKSMNDLFNYIIKEDGKITIHYRFHPYTNMNISLLKQYHQLFSSFKEIEFVEVPSNIALEDILYYSKAKLIADISSIILYAYTYKTEIITYNNIILTHEPSFNKVINRLPCVLKRIIEESSILIK